MNPLAVVREIVGLTLDVILGNRCPVCRTRSHDWHLCDWTNHPGEGAS